jgi:abortive infection bacteriophage resistance protein
MCARESGGGVPEDYRKPHLSVEDQLALLEGRGLAVSDRARALLTLRSVGYYRLSAYMYPFRRAFSEEELGESSSSISRRSNDFVDGSTFEAVRSLWQFDRRLRLVVLDALEVVETGLKAALAHVLGARDPFGHVDRRALNETECAKESTGGADDRFGEWLRSYAEQQGKAEAEDFVAHYLDKYREPLPIWMATEFIDFGSTVRLLRLMRGEDRNRVAGLHGVSNGTLFGTWMKNLNYVRNVCAHHSRFWNRTPTYKFRKWNPDQASPALAHLAEGGSRSRVYPALAVTASLVRHLDADSPWPQALRGLLIDFPDHPALSIHDGMGLPEDWESLSLWS